jgi:hypothetical protein
MSNNNEDVIDINKRYYILMHPFEIVSPLLGIALKSSNSRAKWVECYIDESRYKLADGYKITLRAIDERYGSESFYQSDFKSMLKNGDVLEKTNPSQHVEEVFWREPLCGAVYLQHSAYIVV